MRETDSGGAGDKSEGSFHPHLIGLPLDLLLAMLPAPRQPLLMSPGPHCTMQPPMAATSVR